jgi:hypothetical protein
VLRLYDFAPYGLLPDGALGSFWRDTIPMLLASRHPELHVISIVKCEGSLLYVNRHELDAGLYMVGNGDPDPSIELYPKPLTPEEAARLFKSLCERTAEPGQEEDTQKWIKVMENMAHDRPAFEGAFTREEAQERRETAIAAARPKRRISRH